MKNKITKLSIGIPAYNEEGNIGDLLHALFLQKLPKNKKIIEIIVISDGSKDRTVEMAKSLKSKKIKVIAGEKREGKNKRLNQIFEKFSGDILILLDGDIRLDNDMVIHKVTKQFLSVKNLGLVAGNVQPLPAKTLPERAFNNYVFSLNFIKSNIRSGRNVYSVRGPLLALSRNFSKKIQLPKTVPDDRYIYLTCIKDNFTFVYEQSAKVWFQSANHLSEQINQAVRYKNQKDVLHTYFDSELLKKEYHVPLSLKLIALLLQIIKDPLAYVTMKLIHLRVLLGNKTTKMNKTWTIINSTKKLAI